MATIICYLLFFILSIINLVLPNFDIIPYDVHQAFTMIGGKLLYFNVWLPGLLPIFFQKLQWLISAMIMLWTYDIITAWLRSRKI